MNLPSGTVIGVIGGGQLGKMLIEASRPWNTPYIVLENDLDCPASQVAASVLLGKLTDGEKIAELAAQCDVLTYEIEHINSDALLALEHSGKRIIPSAKALKIIQDKGLQKSFYSRHGIATAPFVLCDNQEALKASMDQFSGERVVIKQRTGGYDGKGVVKLNSADQLDAAFDAPSVLETLIDFNKEISVIVARNERGDINCFPAVECAFNPEANLVEFLFSPANINEDIEKQAVEIAVNIATKLNIVGILAVEMFVTKQGKVLVNEIAPRAHNSGHHSIEGNVTSQFEQHIRAIINLPLGDTSIVRPAVMINLLGEKGHEGAARYEGLDEALGQSGVYVHLYGKAMTKPFRKMGHITVTDKNIDEATRKAIALKNLVKIVS
jgi:5-(carboxyamino)imidazole ribonucleotide synthase